MKGGIHSDPERLTAACVLSIIGGFLDIYTYLYRGKVFANAVTGNMVLFGLNLAERNWLASGRYLLAILSYALGVFVAEIVHGKLPDGRKSLGILNFHFSCCHSSQLPFNLYQEGVVCVFISLRWRSINLPRSPSSAFSLA